MIRISSVKFKNSGFDDIPASNRERDFFLKKNLGKKCAKLLKISESDIAKITIIKHSIDARKKPEIYDLYSVDIILNKLRIPEEKVVKKSGCKNASIVNAKDYIFPANRKENKDKKIETNSPTRPIIIGSGPAGLFCAYELALSGFCPVVIERGMDVDKRSRAVENFWAGGALSEKGNVQFGEGGAGTFSDGKLNTMVKDKHGRNQRSLEIFVQNGADPSILYESKPHIGTDVLKKVVRNIREKIIEKGGEFFFETKVTHLITEDGEFKGFDDVIKSKKIVGVRVEDQREFRSDVVVLAIGHSARDTFYMLKDIGVLMEQKPFAVGLRVEHPQSMINESQYGISDPKSLPPSPYKVTAQSPTGHGVYSFCMCPGGYVVNASSEPGRLCVNGMSYSGRDGNNANSAIIVTVGTSDFGGSDVLSGVEFQRKLEEKAYDIGAGKIPSEYFDDYKNGIRALCENRSDDDVLKNIEAHASGERNSPCMKGDFKFSPVHRILPLEIGKSIVYGMEQFGHMIKGFDRDDAVLSGVEARTSSPVRILRDKNLEASEIIGLYPCGEGAGYAGGITSAAIDGIKVAEQIAIHYYSGKEYLRNKMLNARKELSISLKRNLDRKISEKLLSSEEYKDADNILIFCSTQEEADTYRIIDDCLRIGKNVFCPRIMDKHNSVMEFIKINSADDLEEGAYGIYEPGYSSESIIFNGIKKSTLMIMPGLCFDRHGNRLGYGGGYYDRFIKRFLDGELNDMMKCIAIGYNFQVTDEYFDIYMDYYDIPLDMIVTDEEIIRV